VISNFRHKNVQPFTKNKKINMGAWWSCGYSEFRKSTITTQSKYVYSL